MKTVDEQFFLKKTSIMKLIKHRARHQKMGHGLGFRIANVNGIYGAVNTIPFRASNMFIGYYFGNISTDEQSSFINQRQ